MRKLRVAAIAAVMAVPAIAAASPAQAGMSCVKTYVSYGHTKMGTPVTYLRIVNGCSYGQRLKAVWDFASDGPCTSFKAGQGFTFSKMWGDPGSPAAKLC